MTMSLNAKIYIVETNGQCTEMQLHDCRSQQALTCCRGPQFVQCTLHDDWPNEWLKAFADSCLASGHLCLAVVIRRQSERRLHCFYSYSSERSPRRHARLSTASDCAASVRRNHCVSLP